MTIRFEPGDGSYYAVVQNDFWRGRLYEELLFAEVKPKGDNYVVVWEDAWNKPELFEDFMAAKDYIIKNFKNHIPHVNGWVADMED